MKTRVGIIGAEPSGLLAGQLAGINNVILERRSRTGPPGYDDVVPFARRIVETFPDRGCGAPTGRTRTRSRTCWTTAIFVDWVPRIATTSELQQKLLVDNRMRLYWPEEV